MSLEATVSAGGSARTSSEKLLRDLTTIPNLLSLSRVFLAAGALYTFHREYLAMTLWLLLASAMVDILDGWLARKLDQCTELGAILDRATDLMMESCAMYILVVATGLPFWLFFVYLFREFVVTSARMYMAEIGAEIPKSTLGQRKTNLLMGGFCFALNGRIDLVDFASWSEYGYYLGVGGVLVALLFSYASMAQYLRAFARSYRGI